MKRAALIVVLVAALVAAPAAALAKKKGDGSSRASGAVNQQYVSQTTRDQVVESTNWAGNCSKSACGTNVLATITSRGPVTVTVSADVTGAPVQLRVVSNGRVARPGPARFQGTAGDSSRSFTFVIKGGKKFSKCRELGLEWRSPSGQRATVHKKSVVVTYEGPKPGQPQVGCA